MFQGQDIFLPLLEYLLQLEIAKNKSLTQPFLNLQTDLEVLWFSGLIQYQNTPTGVFTNPKKIYLDNI